MAKQFPPFPRREGGQGVRFRKRVPERVVAMIKLGVNIDHVATIRQARRTVYPDLLAAARAAERGGADGITIHLREDRRHIQDHDVDLLRIGIATKMNLEMAATQEMLQKA